MNAASALDLVIDSVDATPFPEVELQLQAWDDRGRPIQDTLASLEIYENGQPISEVNVDLRQQQVSTGIAIMIDTSGSMRGDPLHQAIEIVRTCFSLKSPRVSFSLIRFDDRSEVVHPLTADVSNIKQALATLQVRGRYTVLKDALFDGIRIALEWPVEARKILLLSDGRDERSQLVMDDAISLANRHHIQVHAIHIGPTAGGLERISKLTGGTSLHVSQVNAETLAELIAPETQFMLHIRYTSPDEKTESRMVTVKLNYGGQHAEAGTYYRRPVRPQTSLLRYWPFAIALAIVAILGGLYGVHRRRSHQCPQCGRKMLRNWSECPFCGEINLSEDILETYEARPPATPLAKLEIPTDAEETKVLLIGERATLGRSPANCVIIRDPSVSKQHAQIIKSNGLFRIYDLGSTNGVFVNGERTSECPLYDEDQIQLGNVKLIFRTCLKNS